MTSSRRPTSTSTPRAAWCSAAGWFARACSRSSGERCRSAVRPRAGSRDEPLAGTASTVRPFLLVENPGPWGVDALRDNRLPDQVKGGLGAAARAAGVRVLFIRRYHRRRTTRRLPRVRGPRRPSRTLGGDRTCWPGPKTCSTSTSPLSAPGVRPASRQHDGQSLLRLHARPPRRLLRRARTADRRGADGRPPGGDLGGLPHRW